MVFYYRPGLVLPEGFPDFSHAVLQSYLSKPSRVGGEGWPMPQRSKMSSKSTIAVDRTAEAYQLKGGRFVRGQA
jgi:hypothetical protein